MDCICGSTVVKFEHLLMGMTEENFVYWLAENLKERDQNWK